jgi:transposase
MHPQIATYVGVDVAKDSLAVRSAHAAKVVTVPNTAQALSAWLAGLPAGAHLVCEATGRHHRLLQRLCAERGVPVSCVNPARARDYARSLGWLEKTDAIDAEGLWRFGTERRPAATPPPRAELQSLCDLLMARHAVVEQITAFGLRQSLLSPQATRHLGKVVRNLRAYRLAVELDLERWLDSPAADPWRDKVQTLCLAPGVSTLSALSLIGYLPELGSLNRRQIAKLAGLAPLPCDSGKFKGLRIIQGGRAPVRRVLYQCAVVAARWHEPTRAHYLQLRARGKRATVAFVALARKLLTYLNSLLRSADSADHDRD